MVKMNINHTKQKKHVLVANPRIKNLRIFLPIYRMMISSPDLWTHEFLISYTVYDC